MTERGLTFIDVDENRLELWLKHDRVQLVVIDSRPELEAGELRRFASTLFTEYVGRDLAARLGAARLALQASREHAGDELAATLDGALHAIDDVAAAMPVPDPDGDPAPPPASEVEVEVAPAPEASAPWPVRELTGRQPYRPLKQAARGKRACERGLPGWHLP